MNVAILYGLFEGKLTGRRLIQELENRGHRVVRDQEEADISIAHSGGAFFARLDREIYFIDPPLATDVPLKRFVRHLIFDIKWQLTHPNPGFYITKTAKNIYYFLFGWPHTFQLVRARKSPLPTPKILITTNDTSWSTPKELRFFRHINADHDDLWRRPAIYCDIIGL